jgi:ribonucleoside-diphosphate reductase alpha chain
MKITRRFTRSDQNVFDTVEWTLRTSRITNADGSVVFEMKDAEVPKSWSQLATDIMVSKYFRKAGVPVSPLPLGEGSGVRASREHGSFSTQGKSEVPSPRPSPTGRGGETGPEKSVRQVVHRLAGCWKHWGETHGYFDSAEDAQAFYDELAYMLLHQMAAPNSPQWFNTGLNWAYGISGPAQGHFIANPETGEVRLADDAYSHPQPHACFIQSVRDDLVGSGGIMDLWVREARLFKYGSGTGTNFSSIRGENEPLSGGGTSSGLMSWLRIGDRAAGAIKSGGTTRRAAKMVCLDADHPDIEQFVNWKVREELKVAALCEGLKHLSGDQKSLATSLGLKLTYDFNGEAYYTVSGQNSNNSVRLTDAFFNAVENDGEWTLRRRTDGAASKVMKARDLWDQICRAAWRCADPGVQYDTTINAWHTCPNSGRINASNPCSEYMFLDDTACNLASINLLQFFDSEQRRFDLDGYEHAINLWTIVLEISVLMAAFPSEEIARQSYRFRTLGLGYANLGAMLMQAGIPYDSEDARAICGALTAILTGRSYAMSAQMAGELTPFPGFAKNRDAMMRVIRNHRRAAYGVPRDSDAYETLLIKPVPIDHERFKSGGMNLANAMDLLDRATQSWDDALELGVKYGYRNAQVTVIAPTGTIGLLMDCDTTGVEPDFALVKFKKLAGGGYFKIANASLRPALKSLGYDDEQTDEIVQHVMGTLSVDTPLPAGMQSSSRTFRDFLHSRGFTSAELVEVENALPTVFELSFAFSAWSMPVRVLKSLGIDPEKARNDASFNGLKALGMTTRQIDELNRLICGTQTVEGAPHIKSEHLSVFDCANKCGAIGVRFIAPQGHIRMMAASQPFISGAISKTINLPEEASQKDIADAYWLSWELGLKANALYRDGSKLSQPLNTKSDVDLDEDGEDTEELAAAVGELSTAVAEVASAISTSSTSSDHHTVTPENSAGRPANGIIGNNGALAPTISPSLLTSPHETIVAPAEPTYVERIIEKIIERPMRRRLPDTRRSITHHFNVAGHEGYLTVGQYDDGSPGELFITMSKEGSTIGGLMDSLGTAISVALQYGVPIESLVTKFAHQRFEPMGMTTNHDIPFAKSLVDYIFRWMGMEFIPGYREANAPPRTQGVKKGVETPASTHVKEDRQPWSEMESLEKARSGGNGSNLTNGLSNRISDPRSLEPVNPRIPGADVAAKTDAPSPRTHSPQSHGGSGNIAAASQIILEAHSVLDRSVKIVAEAATSALINPLDQSNAALMGDAPACDGCGSITVRNGSCYKCMNCGNSMGCS